MPGPFDITFATPGVKNFTFMITDDNGCDSELADYSIEVGEPLLPQTITCDSPPEGMRFDWDDQPCVEEYRIFINGNRQSPDITTSEYIYTRAVQGNTYEIEVVAVSGCGCGTESFTAGPCPFEPAQLCTDVTVNISLPDADTLVCIDGGVAPLKELEAMLVGEANTGSGIWSLEGGMQAITQEGMFDPNIAGVGNHKVKYTWTEGTCEYQDSINFIVTDASAVNFGIEVLDPMCFGEDIGQLNINVSGPEPDFGVYLDEDAFGSKLSEFMVASGEHIVSIIDSLTGCDTLAAFTIMEGPDSLFLFPADEYFARGTENLEVNLDPDYALTIDSLKWLFNGNPICEDLTCGENFVFTPQESGELCFLGYYSGVCMYMECAEVTYFPDFMDYIPNIISLSNQGLTENQTFQVYTNDPLAVIQQMTIYDRWGNVMYQNSAESPSMSWDPRTKSCTPGVYAYLIEIQQADGKVLPRSGTITVVE